MTFVDSPGLVDGDMNYPFDVDEAIRWLGELVDLIFVFFDPIGQVCSAFFIFLYFDRKQRSGPKYVLVQWPFDREQRFGPSSYFVFCMTHSMLMRSFLST